MSGTNVGSLNATLTLSAFEFMHGLEQSKAAALEFSSSVETQMIKANTTVRAVTTGGGGMSASTINAMKQMSFAAQDFSSQFRGTLDSLKPALNGVSNNIMMLTNGLGPWGIAIGAVVSVLGPSLIPELLKMTMGVTENKEAIEANVAVLQKWRKGLDDVRKGQKEAIEAGGADLNEKQLSRKEELEAKFSQAKILRQKAEMNEAAADSAEFQRQAMIQKGGFSSWFGSGQVSDNGAGDRAKAAREELAKVESEMASLRDEYAQGEKLRAKTEQADKARAALEQYAAEKEYRMQAEEAIQNLQKTGLEKYGTEMQKLTEKQRIERETLENSTMGRKDQADALAQLDSMHEAERTKINISDREKLIAERGPDAKASAGLSTASAEGIRAINRAVEGKGENDLQREQLMVEKKQLQMLEQIARMPEGQSVLMAVKGSPTLGEADPFGPEPSSGGTKAENAKTDAISILTDIAQKIAYKVVSLSG